jgi:phosphatidylglycerol:prolipoprotein diacylglycerol transferase
LAPAANVHDFSGFFPLIRLGGGIELPTYFIVVSLALCVCVLWLVRRVDKRGLDRVRALDIALVLMGFGFFGARLFHVFFEEPAYYWTEPTRILEIWKGGFVWYGGALFGAIAAIFYVRRRKMEVGVWLDTFAPVAALGYALGRVACLITGCCYGDVCVLASGFSFRHPTQAYAIVWELCTLGVLLWVEHLRRGRSASVWLRADGRLFALWLLLHSAGRILMETFRADPRGPEPLGLSIATWISLALIIICLFWWINVSRTRQKVVR